jgi:hypothetical protein
MHSLAGVPVPVSVAVSWVGGFGEDSVGVFGPDAGLASFVPGGDVGLDRTDQVFDAGERSASDGLSGDVEKNVPTRFSQDPELGVGVKSR